MSHFSPICPPFLHHFPPFFFLVGTVSYIFHDVFVTTSHFPPFSSIFPHFPPFSPILPHFPPFSLVFPIFPIFLWPAGYWDTPDMDTSWAWVCTPSRGAPLLSTIAHQTGGVGRAHTWPIRIQKGWKNHGKNVRAHEDGLWTGTTRIIAIVKFLSGSVGKGSTIRNQTNC